MRAPSLWGKAAAIAVLLVVLGTIVTQRRALLSCGRNWDDFSDGSVEAKQLRNVPDVLNYILLHKRDVSLVAFDIGDEANGIYLNADEPRPSAGMAQLQLLLGYSAALAHAELQPEARVPVADWERYWLPRTDGGSHEYTVRALQARGALTPDGVRLQDLAQGIMRYSDDAAADHLMSMLGRARVDALPAQLAIPGSEPPWPLSGQILSWQNTQLQVPAEQLVARYRGLTRPQYADVVWQLFAALDDPARAAAERARLQDEGLTLRLRDQAALTAVTSPRGRASDYAQLMARVASGELPGSEHARAALGWLLKNPELSRQFEQVATKASSLPGVLSSAYYARAKGHDKVRVLALFLDKLPTAVWLQLMQKFVHQRFELQLLGDDVFFKLVQQRLAQ